MPFSRRSIAVLQPADHGTAQPQHQAIPDAGLLMISARRTTDTALPHAPLRHRGRSPRSYRSRWQSIAPQRIGTGLDGERRTTREPDARVVTRAGVGVDAEALAHHALAACNLPANLRLEAAADG